MVKDEIEPFDEEQLKNILEIFPYRNWEASSSEIVEYLSKGEKLFEGDREKFMNLVSLMKAKAEIVDKVNKMKYCEV